MKIIKIFTIIISTALTFVAAQDASILPVPDPVDPAPPVDPVPVPVDPNPPIDIIRPVDPVEICEENEIYTSCGSYCGGNCKDFRVPSGEMACIAVCKVGCVCAGGYLRHPITEKCVPSDSCPTTDEFDYFNNVPITPPDHQCTNPHELWSDCGDTCYGDGCTVGDHVCVVGCGPGCFCECGYFRQDGVCVPQSECRSFNHFNNQFCPKPVEVCEKKNEVYSDCAPYCEPTCKDFRVPEEAMMCITLCRTGCTCMNGYLRHPLTGDCVLQDSCPTTDEFDYTNNVPIKPHKSKCGHKKSKRSKKIIAIIVD